MTTEDGASAVQEEVLIANDVLSFVQCKIDSLTKEQLVDILHGYYKLDVITEARDALYRDPPDDMPGRLKRRSNKRDILEDLYDVMQLYGVHAPNRIYVCRNLNNIPPVSMKNIDPVMIYRQTIDCRSEVENMKKEHEQQLATLMDVVIQLRDDVGRLASSTRSCFCSAQTAAPPSVTTATSFRDRLVQGATTLNSTRTATPEAAMSASPNNASDPPPPPPPPPPPAGGGQGTGARNRASTTQAKTTNRPPQAPAMGLNLGRAVASSTVSHFDASPPPFGPTRGKGWVCDSDGFWSRERAMRERQPNQQQQRPHLDQQRPKSTIGTGTRQRLRVVPVVPVVRHDIFVTRLHPETSVADIQESVRDVIGNAAVTIIKLRTRHDTYASFRVSCQQRPHFDALLESDAWDAGALVREYVPSSERPTTRPAYSDSSRY